MAKTKISEYSATAANNTDVESVNIAEGCAPSGINNAIREVMSHLKDFQVGSAGDDLTVGGNFSVTGTVTIPDNAISGDKVEGGTINAITINTLSANPTLSAGTANGVTYLNGSKVLTSGSALTFDGSNLGLGVTPSAWFSSERVIQVGLGSAFGGRTNNASETNVYANTLINSGGSAVYIADGLATRYAQDGGKHLWYIAPSGTAGNAIYVYSGDDSGCKWEFGDWDEFSARHIRHNESLWNYCHSHRFAGGRKPYLETRKSTCGCCKRWICNPRRDKRR
jgi:hypothetical protein